MPERPAKKPSKKPRPKRKPSPGQELMLLLGRIATNHPAARLEVDLARDAAMEAFARLHKDITKLTRYVRRLYRARKQRTELRDRLVRVLHELAAGQVTLPRPPGRPEVPHEELLATFRQLKLHDVPEVARALKAAIGRKQAATYQRFLVQEVFVKGGCAMAEHLLREGHKPFDAAAEQEFLGRLRHHVAGQVVQGLARRAGYEAAPEIARQLDAMIGRAVRFLGDVMMASPEGRLIIPADGAAFDPELHEAIAGRPSEGPLRVRTTLFPGYALLGEPGWVVEKALVYTERVGKPEPVAS